MAYNEVAESGVWKPKEVGEKFEGILESRKTLKGAQGDYVQFTFKQMETNEEFRLSGIVLQNKLADVPDGSQVLLTYKGKPKNTYPDYSVAVWDNKPEL